MATDSGQRTSTVSHHLLRWTSWPHYNRKRMLTVYLSHMYHLSSAFIDSVLCYPIDYSWCFIGPCVCHSNPCLNGTFLTSFNCYDITTFRFSNIMGQSAFVWLCYLLSYSYAVAAHSESVAPEYCKHPSTRRCVCQIFLSAVIYAGKRPGTLYFACVGNYFCGAKCPNRSFQDHVWSQCCKYNCAIGELSGLSLFP